MISWKTCLDEAWKHFPISSWITIYCSYYISFYDTISLCSTDICISMLEMIIDCIIRPSISEKILLTNYYERISLTAASCSLKSHNEVSHLHIEFPCTARLCRKFLSSYTYIIIMLCNLIIQLTSLPLTHHLDKQPYQTRKQNVAITACFNHVNAQLRHASSCSHEWFTLYYSSLIIPVNLRSQKLISRMNYICE